MEQYRHGDVFLQQVVSLPEGATEQEAEGDVILAYGEVTGHAHRIKERTVSLWLAGEQRYIAVERPSRLTHEEHHTITIPPGIYEVSIQREYTPEAIRLVAD